MNVAWGAAAAALLLAGATTLNAADRYAFELPAGRSLDFEIELPLDRAGRLSILAEWAGERVLSFRFEGPGSLSIRRSGPSPQTLSIDVPAEAVSGQPAQLTIHGLPSRDASKGTLTIDRPEAPPAPSQDCLEVAAPAIEPDPWTEPREIPPGLVAPARRLYEDLEKFRRLVLPGGATSADACLWQQGLLEHLWEATGGADLREPAPLLLAEETRRILRDLVAAVRRVEELRVSKDSVIAGPVPEDPFRRRAFLSVREERIRPLVAELDALTIALRRGHAPEIEGKSWPSRFIGCVTACERYFEERTRLGDERASNRELAAEQWERILAATRVLESLLGAEASDPARAP